MNVNPRHSLFPVVLFLIIGIQAHAQLKITDNSDISIDKNAILQLGGTTKGLLPPYVVLAAIDDSSPLQEPILQGMLVCDTTGAYVTKGYYFWNGSRWVRIGIATQGEGFINPVEVNTSRTLQPDENMVLASAGEANDYLLQLTLPAISSSDDGLTFTIKHNGSHKDLIVVLPGTGASINDFYLFPLFRHESVKLIAWNGTWISYDTHIKSKRDYFVAPTSSWKNLHEAIEFMDLHQALPIVTFNPLITIAPGTYVVDSTIVINSGRPLTIQGHSYGNIILVPGDNLDGPMFIAETETYFKMLVFDATGNENNEDYGTSPGHDGILLSGEDHTYYEIKDAMFIGFYNAVNITNNAEFWFFEADVYDCHHSALLIDDTSVTGGTFVKVSEVDFINNNIGVYLKEGKNAALSFINGGFYPGEGNVGIQYDPLTFTEIESIFITGNNWDNTGVFSTGFEMV